jgi:membrane-bound metal-dependent hydrolase YbcI (DUF457 family)
MNRQIHLGLGVVLFLCYFSFARSIYDTNIAFFAFGIIAVTVGSVCPDILEPPTGPTHRGIFHSWPMLKAVTLLFLVAAVLGLLGSDIPHTLLVFSCSCFFLGYSTHLLADSMTRAGLPR